MDLEGQKYTLEVYKDLEKKKALLFTHIRKKKIVKKLKIRSRRY